MDIKENVKYNSATAYFVIILIYENIKKSNKNLIIPGGASTRKGVIF